MSLFRIAVVLGLAVAVMPSDKEQQARLYQQAAHAAHWTTTFCDRNPAMCEEAGHVWSAFLKKAQFAAATAWDVAQRRMATGEQGRVEDADYTAPSPLLLERSRGTLTRGDLEPAWRGREGA